MPIKNILFIMADQLRADYLSCYGHPHLKTPAMDGIAARGVRFSRAFVQAPVCGPSRMSIYTGRYMSTHGSTWNGVPLRVGEMTMGDHLRTLGTRVALVGKTHMTADLAGFARLGLNPHSQEGVLASECGFEPFERDDGLWPDEPASADLAYNRYLRSKGYEGNNPWHTVANSAQKGGETLSGWLMRNAREPARVADEHSETAYMTDRAMDFISEAGSQPWCLHLSYIKPHWPYIAPAPYHNMFGAQHIIAPNRSDRERADPHPVVKAYMHHEESINFSRDDVRETVIPAYMGLIRQLDDHLARLFTWMAARGLFDDTMIVITSDHGDYLGDHWLGEKELFHEESIRIPLIIYNPDSSADATRGRVDDRLVESIDLAPTFLEALGGKPLPHILEGRSLMPALRADTVQTWRDAVISECDYSFREARLELGIGPTASRAYMVRTATWKYIHYEGFRPQLFDLQNDPQEFLDLGTDPSKAAIRAQMHEFLADWALHRKSRTTISDEDIAKRTGTHKKRGLPFGVW
jgi:arylsulfatase A-like enzyme